MKPWKTLDTATAPGGETYALLQRDDEYVIRVDGAELMSSRRHGSEEAMAEVAADALARPGARVLVGGLGFGYTLRASKERLGPGGRIVVAEISDAVLQWNQRLVGHLALHPLHDKRVSVERADVRAVLVRAAAAFDAILMDVDNGPAAVAARSNRMLWKPEGIDAVRRALRPRGRLVVWSAQPEPRFASQLRAAGFAVTLHEARAQGGRGARHTLFVAE